MANMEPRQLDYLLSTTHSLLGLIVIASLKLGSLQVLPLPQAS